MYGCDSGQFKASVMKIRHDSSLAHESDSFAGNSFPILSVPVPPWAEYRFRSGSCGDALLTP